MILALSAIDYDPAGHIRIIGLPTSNTGDTTRRVSRVATLDGGVAINDSGYAEGDRTIVAQWRPISKWHEDAIDRLVRIHGRLRVSTREGCFLAVPERYRPGPSRSELTLLVIEREG